MVVLCCLHTRAMDPVFLYKPADGGQCGCEYQGNYHDNVSCCPLHREVLNIVRSLIIVTGLYNEISGIESGLRPQALQSSGALGLCQSHEIRK